MSRHVHRRLAAGLVSTALIGGGIALGTAAPAHAEASGGTATYMCSSLLGLVSEGSLNVIPGDPTRTSATTATVPITMILDGAVANGGILSSLIDTLDSALGSALPDGLLSSGAQTLTGTLTESVQDGDESLPVPLPPSLDLGGILGPDDVVCDLVAPLDDLPLPGLAGDTGSAPTKLTTPAKPKPAPTAHATPTKHATKRVHPKLHAKMAKKRVHHRKHPRVKVTVRSAGKPVAGSIVVRFHDRVIGHGHLHKGRLVLKLKHLARGKKTVKVIFQKTAKFKRTVKKVSFRIVK